MIAPAHRARAARNFGNVCAGGSIPRGEGPAVMNNYGIGPHFCLYANYGARLALPSSPPGRGRSGGIDSPRGGSSGALFYRGSRRGSVNRGFGRRLMSPFARARVRSRRGPIWARAPGQLMRSVLISDAVILRRASFTFRLSAAVAVN